MVHTFLKTHDKLKIAIALLEKGLPIDEISIALDWKDF